MSEAIHDPVKAHDAALAEEKKRQAAAKKAETAEKKRQAARSKKHVAMEKDGETIKVHPRCVKNHEGLGWVQAEKAK